MKESNVDVLNSRKVILFKNGETFLLQEEEDYLVESMMSQNGKNEYVSTILKERRATLNISQLELSEMAGVSLATIKDLERGLGNPSLKTLERIAVVLGLELTLTRKQTF